MSETLDIVNSQDSKEPSHDTFLQRIDPSLTRDYFGENRSQLFFFMQREVWTRCLDAFLYKVKDWFGIREPLDVDIEADVDIVRSAASEVAETEGLTKEVRQLWENLGWLEKGRFSAANDLLDKGSHYQIGYVFNRTRS